MQTSIKRLTYSAFASYDEAEADEINFSGSVASKKCPICWTGFKPFTHSLPSKRTLHLQLCPACGWWHLHRDETIKLIGSDDLTSGRWFEMYHAVFSEIALNSPSLPIDELRRHLTRYWEQRKHITAQQAEDLIASVLRDYYGGDVLRVTANANTPDGGVDLFITSKDGIVKRAVQVKRRLSKEVEPLEDVRQFVGAMIMSGSDSGVFVTTAARFSRGALNVADNRNVLKHRLDISLIDGERLLELLEFTNRDAEPQLPPYVNLDQDWISQDGTKVAAARLLFGNLSRLSTR